jgi:hypothetical protein
MRKWEYMWVYCSDSRGSLTYIANGERLPAQSYAEALNVLGKQGWELVAVIPPSAVRTATQTYAQFCLKRPIPDESP